MAKEITQSERAAIYYHLVGRCDNWQELYKIAKGEDAYNRLTEGSQNVAVSRWKNSDSIQNAIKEISYLLQKEREEIEARAVDNFKNRPQEEGGSLSDVNFLDRDEFLQFLNKQANRISDEKTKNDYLKMISDNLRFKDMEKDKEDEEIRRFYIPLTCQDCDLYNRCKVCPLDKCPNAE